MAFTHQQQIGTVNQLRNQDLEPVGVGVSGVPIGSLVVVVMTCQFAITPAVSDSQGNIYTVHEQRNEAIGTGEVAIASSIITTALVNGDTISPSYGTGHKERTAHINEYRAGGAITFSQATGANSSFPHATKSAGTLTDTTNKLVVGGFLILEEGTGATWTPGTGFTTLSQIDSGDILAFAQYDLDGAGASHAVAATCTVDKPNAGVSACWSEGAAPPSGPRVGSLTLLGVGR